MILLLRWNKLNENKNFIGDSSEDQCFLNDINFLLDILLLYH